MTAPARQYSAADQFCIGIDTLLRGLFAANAGTTASGRANPADSLNMPTPELSATEQAHSAGLMRVNHVGEVCAQALYLGQALTARDTDTRAHLLQSAREEADHLHWCEQRVRELNSHTSILNPLWFAGAYSIGFAAGCLGDGWNLGFVVETERQVEAHLDQHLQILPAADQRSRVIIEQMQSDEIAHAQAALERGARELPGPVKFVMRASAKIMTTTAYYL